MSSDDASDGLGGARHRVTGPRRVTRGASVVSEGAATTASLDTFEDAVATVQQQQQQPSLEAPDAICRHPSSPPDVLHRRHDSEDYGDLELLPPLEAFLQENASLCGSLENDLLPSTPLTEEQLRAARDEDVANVPINR